jgi:hypothetical protein
MKLINKKTWLFVVLIAYFSASLAQAQVLEEFQYPYDSTKMNLTMESTETTQLAQEWQPVLIHGTWSSVDSITSTVRHTFEQLGRRVAFFA